MKYKINDNELIYMIQEDKDYYFKILLTKYQPVINSIVSNYFRSFIKLGIDFDDLIQECNVAVYLACKSFNPYKNIKFYTYVTLCIRNHIKVFYRDMNIKRYMLLNDALSIDDGFIFEKGYNLEYNDYEKDFVKLKNKFNDKCSEVFELRYNGFSYKEISKLLDIPISTVDGRICKIKAILRK